MAALPTPSATQSIFPPNPGAAIPKGMGPTNMITGLVAPILQQNPPLLPAQNLDQLLALLRNAQADESIRAIHALENMAMNQPLSVQRIIQALIETAVDSDRPIEVSSQCVTSFRNLIPCMSPAQIRLVLLPMLENILGEEEINAENSVTTVTNLIATDVNVLIPILLNELEKIVRPDAHRDESTIHCSEGLLKALSRIMIEQQGHITPLIWALIVEHLKKAKIEETNRRLDRLGQLLINPKILDNALLTLARFFANDPLIDFLIQDVIETGDVEEPANASILPITEAALQAFLKGPSQARLQEFIDYITDSESYNILWILGEIARLTNTSIPIEAIPGLLNMMLKILDHSKKWQLACHAAEALGKIWSILNANQKILTIQALHRGLLGMHNIANVYPVQRAAARALGEIGIIGGPQVADMMIAILKAQLTETDHDVRLAIVKALKRLSVVSIPIQCPLIFTALVGSLSDKDAKVRKVAAKAVSELTKQHQPYVATQLQAVIDAAGRALTIAPDTNPKKWGHARTAVIWMLHDVALIVPINQRQNARILVGAYAQDASEIVREAVQECLPRI